MRARFPATLAVAGLLTMSCGGIIGPSQNTVETFSGTVSVGGSKAHPFSASKTGEFTVKITALSPISSTVVGLLWAQAASDGACGANLAILQQNNFATLNVQALGGSMLSGKYCILVYDVGAFTTTETYTITVSHP